MVSKRGAPHIPSWQRLLKENGKIVSESIHDLPEDLRVVLEPQGIRAILVYPLWRDKQIVGSIGFDECFRQRAWSTQELGALRTLSGMFAPAMEIGCGCAHGERFRKKTSKPKNH